MFMDSFEFLEKLFTSCLVYREYRFSRFSGRCKYEIGPVAKYPTIQVLLKCDQWDVQWPASFALEKHYAWTLSREKEPSKPQWVSIGVRRVYFAVRHLVQSQPATKLSRSRNATWFRGCPMTVTCRGSASPSR